MGPSLSLEVGQALMEGQTLSKSALDILSQMLHKESNKTRTTLHSATQSALSCSRICCFCEKQFEVAGTIIIFPCGHHFHSSCLIRRGECIECCETVAGMFRAHMGGVEGTAIRREKVDRHSDPGREVRRAMKEWELKMNEYAS
jgi:hypothetical protein